MKGKLLWAAGLLAAVAFWVFWANTAMEVNEWIVESENLPAAFDGLRIAQVSDLHNADHWEDALKALADARPDIIVLTGDLIDSRNTDVAAALAFVRGAVELGPCYYVTGNHESRVRQWPELRRGLLEAGVTVLEDESCRLERNGAAITLIGLMDPDFGRDFGGALERLAAGEGYTVLLSHRPERMGQYAAAGVDLVFAGHAHGGQVRIPFIGGLIAPHQGWFPEFDSGIYRQGKTVMLVSRGVGNSIIPLRINNRPEILVAVLKRTQ